MLRTSCLRMISSLLINAGGSLKFTVDIFPSPLLFFENNGEARRPAAVNSYRSGDISRYIRGSAETDIFIRLVTCRIHQVKNLQDLGIYSRGGATLALLLDIFPPFSEEEVLRSGVNHPDPPRSIFSAAEETSSRGVYVRALCPRQMFFKYSLTHKQRVGAQGKYRRPFPRLRH